MSDQPQATGADARSEEKFKADLIALIPHMRAFARTMTGHPAQADDLAQEALAKAWQCRDSFTMGTNMKAWAFMILRNQFYSDMRRAWRNVQLDQEAAERTLLASDDPNAPIELNELRMAMATLPVDQREAVILVGAGEEEAASADDADTALIEALTRMGPADAASEVSKALGLKRRDLYRRALEMKGQA